VARAYLLKNEGKKWPGGLKKRGGVWGGKGGSVRFGEEVGFICGVVLWILYCCGYGVCLGVRSRVEVGSGRLGVSRGVVRKGGWLVKAAGEKERRVRGPAEAVGGQSCGPAKDVVGVGVVVGEDTLWVGFVEFFWWWGGERL